MKEDWHFQKRDTTKESCIWLSGKRENGYGWRTEGRGGCSLPRKRTGSTFSLRAGNLRKKRSISFLKIRPGRTIGSEKRLTAFTEEGKRTVKAAGCQTVRSEDSRPAKAAAVRTDQEDAKRKEAEYVESRCH